MRGSTGVSTGGPDHPLPHGKAVDYLRITGWKLESYRCRVIIGPLARRHFYDVSLAGRWLSVLVTFCVRASLTAMNTVK